MSLHLSLSLLPSRQVERLQDRLFQHRSTVTELKAVVAEERRKSRLLTVENNIDGASVCVLLTNSCALWGNTCVCCANTSYISVQFQL